MSGGESNQEVKSLGTEYSATNVQDFVAHMAALGQTIDPKTAEALIGIQAVRNKKTGGILGYANREGALYASGADNQPSPDIQRLVTDFQNYYKNKAYLDYTDLAKARPGRSATILVQPSGPEAKTLLGAPSGKTVLGG